MNNKYFNWTILLILSTTFTTTSFPVFAQEINKDKKETTASIDINGLWRDSGEIVRITQTGNSVESVVIRTSEEGSNKYGFKPGDWDFTATRNNLDVTGQIHLRYPLKPYKEICPAQWDTQGILKLKLQPDGNTLTGVWAKKRINENCETTSKVWEETITYVRQDLTKLNPLDFVQVSFVKEDGKYFHPIEEISFDRPFYIEARFPIEPKQGNYKLSLQNLDKETRMLVEVTKKESMVFRSKKLKLEETTINVEPQDKLQTSFFGVKSNTILVKENKCGHKLLPTISLEPKNLIDNYRTKIVVTSNGFFGIGKIKTGGKLCPIKLAKDLLSRMPYNRDLVVKVLRNLKYSEKDNVSYYFLENASDRQIKSFTRNYEGRRVLALMLAHMAEGKQTDEEEKQAYRVYKLANNDLPAMENQQSKIEKNNQKNNVQNLIYNYKDKIKITFLWNSFTINYNLREEELAKSLLKLLNSSSDNFVLVYNVLEQLSQENNADDVSLAFFKAANNEQITKIAKSSDGRYLMLRMVHKLFKGDMSDSERKQMKRIMKLITKIDNINLKNNNKTPQVEIITYLKGGSFLDSIGFGAKGHTAVAIGDLIYSFEAGWRVGITKADYLNAKSLNEKPGIGQVLNLTPKQVAILQQEFNGLCGEGYYLISGDICTDSVGNVLKKILTKLKSGWNPQKFVDYLDDTGKVKDYKFYPKKAQSKKKK